MSSDFSGFLWRNLLHCMRSCSCSLALVRNFLCDSHFLSSFFCPSTNHIYANRLDFVPLGILVFVPTWIWSQEYSRIFGLWGSLVKQHLQELSTFEVCSSAIFNPVRLCQRDITTQCFF